MTDHAHDLPWSKCRIVEEDANGELILLEDNVQHLVDMAKSRGQDSGTPVAIVTFLGSPTEGKAFFTNLLALCSKSKGASWANEIQTTGLQGFAFGNKISHDSDGDRTCKTEDILREVGRNTNDESANGLLPARNVEPILETGHRSITPEMQCTEEQGIISQLAEAISIIEKKLGNEKDGIQFEAGKKAIENLVEATRNLETLHNHDNHVTTRNEMRRGTVNTDGDDDESSHSQISKSLPESRDKGRIHSTTESSEESQDDAYVMIDMEVDELGNGNIEQGGSMMLKVEENGQLKGTTTPVEHVDPVADIESRPRESSPSPRVATGIDCDEVRLDSPDHHGGPHFENGKGLDNSDTADKLSPDAQESGRMDARRVDPVNGCNLRNGMFFPDETVNGIYCWPEFIKLDHCDTLLWILYVHQNDHCMDNQQLGAALSILAEHVSSVVVDIQWEETLAASPEETVPRGKHSSFGGNHCDHLIRIVKHDDKVTTKEDSQPSHHQTFNSFVDLNGISSNNGPQPILLEPKQCRAIESIVKAITDEDVLKSCNQKTKSALSVSSLCTYLRSHVSKLKRKRNRRSYDDSCQLIARRKTPEKRGKQVSSTYEHHCNDFPRKVHNQKSNDESSEPSDHSNNETDKNAMSSNKTNATSSNGGHQSPLHAHPYSPGNARPYSHGNERPGTPSNVPPKSHSNIHSESNRNEEPDSLRNDQPQPASNGLLKPHGNPLRESINNGPRKSSSQGHPESIMNGLRELSGEELPESTINVPPKSHTNGLSKPPTTAQPKPPTNGLPKIFTNDQLTPPTNVRPKPPTNGLFKPPSNRLPKPSNNGEPESLRNIINGLPSNKLESGVVFKKEVLPAVKVTTKELRPARETNKPNQATNDISAQSLTRSKETEDSEAIEEIILTLQSEWSALQFNLKHWIENDLNSNNINDITEIYNFWWKTFLQQKMGPRQKSSAAINAEKYKNIADMLYIPLITEIEACIFQFCEKIHSHMNKPSPHPDSQIESVANQVIIQISKQVKRQESLEFIHQACTTLMNIYLGDNAKQQEASKRISDATVLRIREFYQQHFDHQLSNKGPYHPEELFKSHSRLMTTLLKVYLETVGETVDLSQGNIDLRNLLLSDFNNTSAQNMTKLEAVMRQINESIKKRKGEYESRMDALLRENRNGLVPSRFQSEHKKTLVDCIMKLHNDISQISKDEPMEIHDTVLEKLVEKVYKTMEKENEAALKEHGGSCSEPTEPTQITEPIKRQQIDNNLPAMLTPETHAVNLSKRILLFQLSLPKVGVAALSSSSTSAEPEDMMFYPATLALLGNDEWVFGDDVSKRTCQNPKNFKRIWNIGECWYINGWKDKIIINGEVIETTAEFLLTMLFTLSAPQHETTIGTITEAIVAVPYWLSSLQRQQVLDAATIAGFTRTQLINENSCSAYFMYYNNLHTSAHDTVVISENSLKVDISIYAYQPNSGLLSLLGHCGDYETNDLPKKPGRVYKFLSGILSYFMSHQYEAGIEDEALQNLYQLWQLALNRAEGKRPGCKSRPRKVLLCCESEEWRGLLWNLARKITDEPFISVRSDTVLHGAASICSSQQIRKDESTSRLIADGSTFNVSLRGPRNEHIVATQVTSTNLASESRKFSCVLYNTECTYQVRQTNSGLDITIAKLTVKKLPKRYSKMVATLLQSPDGIFTLQNIQCTRTGMLTGSSHETLPGMYYEWVEHQLDQSTVDVFKSIADQVKMQRAHNDMANDLQESIASGERLKRAISQGSGNFVSRSGSGTALELIDTALIALQNPKIGKLAIQQKKELFLGIATKHNVRI